VFAVSVFGLMVLVLLADRLDKWWATRGGVAAARPSAAGTGDRVDDPRSEPDPRAAVIRAYARFEHAAAAARAPRVPWQTPAEFRRAIVTRLPVPASPVERLTALFEIARFSDRPLGADARATACDALDEITTALEPNEATEPPPSETAHPRFEPGRRSNTDDA
jgi:hypothetical protein